LLIRKIAAINLGVLNYHATFIFVLVILLVGKPARAEEFEIKAVSGFIVEFKFVLILLFDGK